MRVPKTHFVLIPKSEFLKNWTKIFEQFRSDLRVEISGPEPPAQCHRGSERQAKIGIWHS